MSLEPEQPSAEEGADQVLELPTRYVMSIISPFFGGPVYLNLAGTAAASAAPVAEPPPVE